MDRRRAYLLFVVRENRQHGASPSDASDALSAWIVVHSAASSDFMRTSCRCNTLDQHLRSRDHVIHADY